MATFAVIDNKVVINTIIADTLEIAEEVTGNICVEYTDDAPAGIAWNYDPETQTFSPPIIVEESELEEPTE
jgi:hypothetical protein